MRQESGLRLSLVVLLLSLSAAALGQAMDTHASGFPDDTLITAPAERRAFRLWFASIAEAQYTAPSPAWEHRDCSALLRFAYVQAPQPGRSSEPPPALPGGACLVRRHSAGRQAAQP